MYLTLMFFRAVIVVLCLVCFFKSEFSFAVDNCNRVLSRQPLTAQELGTAWQKASWRKGMHPFRYYNFRAVDVVVSHPDLEEVAVNWMLLNASTTNGKLADTTYQFLIALADYRVKFDLPPPDERRPMLDYLSIVIKSALENPLTDSSRDIEIMSKVNEFFHLDAGMDRRENEKLMKLVNGEIGPRYHSLKMTQSF